MAHNSPSHRFGQIIGELFEKAITDFLRQIAFKNSLYFDYKHPRKARSGKVDVVWEDAQGNPHKLDVVMEKNGSDDVFGEPCAFIEIAWRSYKRYSKNKVQEISGAILPVVAKYKNCSPFYGAILSGVFTESAIKQLESQGFAVVYIQRGTIEEAFMSVGIDSFWHENADAEVLQTKVNAYDKLTQAEKNKIQEELLGLSHKELESFERKLCNWHNRKIKCIKVMPVFGNQSLFLCVKQACDYILNYEENSSDTIFTRFEIKIEYTNGDKIEAEFVDRGTAVQFIETCLGVQ